MTPIRIQRKRSKGWTMPPNTVYVGRGSKWGNPFKVGNPDNEERLEYTAEESLKWYRLWVLGKIQVTKELDINDLRGKNLACWCPLDKPCHADFLLELANNGA